MYYRIVVINANQMYYLNINGDRYLQQIEKLLKTAKYDIYYIMENFHYNITKYRFYVPSEQDFSLKDSFEMDDLRRIPIVVACFDSSDQIKNYTGNFGEIFSLRPQDSEKLISEWLLSIGCQKENVRKIKKPPFIKPSMNQFNTITGI